MELLSTIDHYRSLSTTIDHYRSLSTAGKACSHISSYGKISIRHHPLRSSCRLASKAFNVSMCVCERERWIESSLTLQLIFPLALLQCATQLEALECRQAELSWQHLARSTRGGLLRPADWRHHQVQWRTHRATAAVTANPSGHMLPTSRRH